MIKFYSRYLKSHIFIFKSLIMEEKSNIETLKDFAKATNRTVNSTEKQYPDSGLRTRLKYNRQVCIPNNADRTSFYFCYSDPYGSFANPIIYSGAFIPLPSNIKSKVNIRNKNVIDRLNVLSKNKDNNLGNENFDKKVLISNTLDAATKRLLSSSKLQTLLLEALSIDKSIIISINEHNVDFVPELKGQSYLSIIDPQFWRLEAKEIEKFFEQIEKVRTFIDGSKGD